MNINCRDSVPKAKKEQKGRHLVKERT